MKKIILFHADWCSHCKTFAGEWDRIKEQLDKLGDNPEVTYEEYMHSRTKNNPKLDEEMEKYKVSGFPTIIIIKDDEVETYRGPRKATAILTYLGVNTNQAGGGINKLNGDRDDDEDDEGDIYYKMKYLKYKAKYLKLLEKLMK